VDGDSVALTAAFGPETDTEDIDPQIGVVFRRVRSATITTDPDDAAFGGVAAPAINDTITVGGVTWRVSSIRTKLAGLIRLDLEKQVMHSGSRPGYTSG